MKLKKPGKMLLPMMAVFAALSFGTPAAQAAEECEGGGYSGPTQVNCRNAVTYNGNTRCVQLQFMTVICPEEYDHQCSDRGYSDYGC